MRYYRLPGGEHSEGSGSLVVVDDGDAYDLSTASDDLGSFTRSPRTRATSPSIPSLGTGSPTRSRWRSTTTTYSCR